MDLELLTDNEDFITEMIRRSFSLSIPIDASQRELLASLEKRFKELLTAIKKSNVECREVFEQKDKGMKLEEVLDDYIKVREGIMLELLAKGNIRKKNEQHHRFFEDNPLESSVTNGSSTAESASNMEELHKSLQDDLDLEIALDRQILEWVAKIDSLQKENEQLRSDHQSFIALYQLKETITRRNQWLKTYYSNRAANESAEPLKVCSTLMGQVHPGGRENCKIRDINSGTHFCPNCPSTGFVWFY